MRTTLSSILDATRARVTDLRTRRRAVEEAAATAPAPPSWTEALSGDDVAVIAEVKRRSPSAGAIAPELDPAAHAKRYAAGGARALSVLTEGPHFGGSPDDLVAVRRAVPLPILRKDFIVDPIQLYETRALGASAVLLIVCALDDAALRELAALALELGLARLIEVHDAGELTRALRLDPEAIGVNSRDLATFRTDLSAIEPIVRAVPADVLTVAESGITSRQDVERVARWGADAILVGTVLARMTDPTAGVREFTGVRRGGPNDVEAAPGGRS